MLPLTTFSTPRMPRRAHSVPIAALLLLSACATTSQIDERIDQWEASQREEIEALKNALQVRVTLMVVSVRIGVRPRQTKIRPGKANHQLNSSLASSQRRVCYGIEEENRGEEERWPVGRMPKEILPGLIL